MQNLHCGHGMHIRPPLPSVARARDCSVHNLRKTLALVAAVLLGMIPVTANADVVRIPGILVPGQDTGVYGEQTCPPPTGCVESGNTQLGFSIANNPGSMSLAFVGVVAPPGTGFYTFDVQVFDPMNNIIASGIGSPSLLIASFNVDLADNYYINIDWTFSGAGTAQTASWGVVAATSAAAVPEPGALALVGLGLIAVGVTRRSKAR